jgi:Tol biopolymer transport system component
VGDVWPGYAFTPDGKSLVFSNRSKLRGSTWRRAPSRTIPFTAQVEQWAAPRVAWQEQVETGPVRAKILRWPSQSPDGRLDRVRGVRARLAAGRLGRPGRGAPRRLTRMTPRCRAASTRRPSPPTASGSRTSPGATPREATSGRLRPPQAPRRRRLTRAPGHYINPEWSPKGDRLALLRGSGLEFRGRQPEDEEYFEIALLDAAGGTSSR